MARVIRVHSALEKAAPLGAPSLPGVSAPDVDLLAMRLRALEILWQFSGDANLISDLCHDQNCTSRCDSGAGMFLLQRSRMVLAGEIIFAAAAAAAAAARYIGSGASHNSTVYRA